MQGVGTELFRMMLERAGYTSVALFGGVKLDGGVFLLQWRALLAVLPDRVPVNKFTVMRDRDTRAKLARSTQTPVATSS